MAPGDTFRVGNSDYYNFYVTGYITSDPTYTWGTGELRDTAYNLCYTQDTINGCFAWINLSSYLEPAATPYELTYSLNCYGYVAPSLPSQSPPAPLPSRCEGTSAFELEPTTSTSYFDLFGQGACSNDGTLSETCPSDTCKEVLSNVSGAMF